MESSLVLLDDYGIDKDYEGEMKSVLLHVGGNMDLYEVNVPKLPDGWVDLYTNTSKGGPTFKNWTTQANGLASPTTLYLRL